MSAREIHRFSITRRKLFSNGFLLVWLISKIPIENGSYISITIMLRRFWMKLKILSSVFEFSVGW